MALEYQIGLKACFLIKWKTIDFQKFEFVYFCLDIIINGKKHFS